MTELDRGPLLQRFEVDPAIELSLSRLRLGAAILASLGAVAMLLASLPFVIMLVAVLALLVSAGWVAKARGAARRAHHAEEHFLMLYAQGLEVAEGPVQTWVPWASVTHIDVDEERLDIVLERRSESPRA